MFTIDISLTTFKEVIRINDDFVDKKFQYHDVTHNQVLVLLF